MGPCCQVVLAEGAWCQRKVQYIRCRYDGGISHQKAFPQPGTGFRMIALDQRFLHFANPGQQLTHSLPALRHLHWVWAALKHAANLEQLKHLAGSLDDNHHLCCCQAFGLRLVLDGAVVCH